MIEINETVLEMHYHKAILDCVRDSLGIGQGGQMNFYKYSPQLECFIGFDQAFARTQLSQKEFYDMLKSSAKDDNYSLPNGNYFLGYFLQYKVGKKLTRRRIATPPSITTNPFIRFGLDTKENVRTGFSQHELLCRLSHNPGALVSYACPMLFLRDELYEDPVDLDGLRLVDVASCPGYFKDNASHNIFFNNETSIPVWASEPKNGEAMSPKSFAAALSRRQRQIDLATSGPILFDLLLGLSVEGPSRPEDAGEKLPCNHVLDALSGSMTILQLWEDG